MSETIYLSIGDYICLYFVKQTAYLCAEGILTEDLYVGGEQILSAFDDCLFQVQLQRQYSAASELQEFLGGLEGSESKSEAESAEDLALKRYL
jgi:hypothetical protein